jgi:hypothetical protein
MTSTSTEIVDIWQNKAKVECIICMDRKSSHLHSLCGVSYCELCIRSLSKCPLCAEDIKVDQILPIIRAETKNKEVTEDKSIEKHDDDVDDDDDPVIKDALEKAKSFRITLAKSIRLHEELPESQRKCCSGTMRIIIECMDGSRSSININPDITVASLAKCRSLHLDICPEKLRFLHRGGYMINDKSLSEQKIKSGDTLHLLTQTRSS